MEDSAPINEPGRSIESPGFGDTLTPLRAVVTAMKIMSVLGGAMVLWLAVWLALGERAASQSWIWHASLPTAILAIVILAIFREARYWWEPAHRLARILPGIRAGERPIDELAALGGGLSQVAPLIQDILHDLRQQRQAVAELEAEMRQRVASRTNALERQLGSLRVQATRDALTGLNNRRTLDAALPKLIDDSRGKSRELSVLAIDVDNFKPLNDTLGHAAGDELLRSIAQILRSGVREGDVVVRCGGDEFIILLPGCPSAPAREMAARLTATINTMCRTLKTPKPAGLSVGVASLKDVAGAVSADEAAKAILASADKHLYEVKSSRKHATQTDKSTAA